MDRRNKKLGANSNQDFQLFIKIPPKGGQEYEPLFLSNLSRLPQPVRKVKYQGRIKRWFDVFASLVGIVVLSPFLLLVAILIKLTSRGPVIFTQQRVGKGGRIFRIFKFRTMYRDADLRKRDLLIYNEMSGPAFKIKNDPRVTKLGRFLRKYSIDELPQLINILKGDMSLVGPRPALIGEAKSWDSSYYKRLAVDQGLTCIWQISGRNDLTFQQWMDMDLEYVNSCSFSLDIKLILKTMLVVFSGQGAY